MQYWMIFVAVFWIFTLFFAKKFPYVIGFFDGLFLSFLCFCFLPIVLEGTLFWAASFLLIAGVLTGSLLEQKTNNFYYETTYYALLHSAAFTLAVVIWSCFKVKESVFCLPFAFLSGFFLLLACGGILPEEKNVRKKVKLAIFGMAGFLLGILYVLPNI